VGSRTDPTFVNFTKTSPSFPNAEESSVGDRNASDAPSPGPPGILLIAICPLIEPFVWISNGIKHYKSETIRSQKLIRDLYQIVRRDHR
jgi:hypothetical protein